MHLQDNILFDLDHHQGHVRCCQGPLHHVTYALVKFEGGMSNGLGDVITKKFNV